MKSMSATKKKRPITRAKKQEQVNKKALIWIGAAFGIIVIVVGVLLALKV
jgi:purine-cytosine permease-like protein